MYRFLDRAVASLDPQSGFLIAAIRGWVAASVQGRCPIAEMQSAFEQRGVPGVLPDFGIVMAALDLDGLTNMHFAPPGWPTIGEDEAILLGLFAAATAIDPAAVYRISASLVADDAVNYLARATKLVAQSLDCTASHRAGGRA